VQRGKTNESFLSKVRKRLATSQNGKNERKYEESEAPGLKKTRPSTQATKKNRRIIPKGKPAQERKRVGGGKNQDKKGETTSAR